MNSPFPGRLCAHLSLLVLLLFSACDFYTQDTFEEEYVVEAYLIADESLPEVRLSKTVAFGEAYDFEEEAVAGAVVEVRLLGTQGSVEKRVVYRASAPGVYEPTEIHRVNPLRTYELAVTVPGTGAFISARTLVPDTFSVLRVSKKEPVYLRDPAPRLDITRSTYPGRQGIYVFAIEALAPEQYGLTPIRKERLKDSDEFTAEDFIVTTSPILFEGNYPVNPDGTVEIGIPWLAVSYYGPNLATAYALDNNTYDFFRSLDVQFGFSTLSPGELQNVIEHVEGGTGVFGSMARVSHEFFIRER